MDAAARCTGKQPRRRHAGGSSDARAKIPGRAYARWSCAAPSGADQNGPDQRQPHRAGVHGSTANGKCRVLAETPIRVDPDAVLVDGVHPAMLQLGKVIEKYVTLYPEQWLVLDPAFMEDLLSPPPGTPGRGLG